MKKITIWLLVLFATWQIQSQVSVNEGFEATTTPTGWTYVSFSRSTTTPCVGVASLRRNFWASGPSGSVTTPNYTSGSNGEQIDVAFDWKTIEYSAGSGVGVSVDIQYSTDNGTTWTTFGNVSSTAITTCATWSGTLSAGTIPNGSDFKLRFNGTHTGGDCYFYIDNVQVTQQTFSPPFCTNIVSPADGAVNVNSGLITWSAGTGAPTGYKLNVGTSSGATDVLNAFDVGNVLSYDIGTLTAGTTYYVTIIPYNANGDATGCSETSFSSCGSMMAPWTYDVEAAAATTNSTIADCWSSNPTATTAAFRWDVDASGSTPSASTGPTAAYSGVKYFYTEASSGTTGAVAELYTPMVDISGLTDPSLQFYYHMYGSTMGELHVDVFDGTTWTNDVDVIIGQQQTAQADPWLQKVVSLATFSGTIQVRFRGIRGTDFYGDMSLDDITFDEAPACLPPTNVVLSNITDATVQIDWDDMSAVSQFDFEYVVQAAGTGTPAGSGTPVADITATETGLTPVTPYEVYVRADCGGGSYSTWVGPISFTTTCAVYTVPALEDFTSYVPACWEEADNGDLTSGPATFGASSWIADGFGNNGTTGSARIEIWLATLNDWIISPTYAIPATGWELKFNAATTQWNTTAAPTTPWESDDVVEVLVSTTGTTNWTVLYTYNNTNVPSTTGDFNIIDLDAYAGQNVRFAFRAVEGTNDGSADLNFYVDDFEIRLTPTCPEPTLFNVSSILDTQVDLAWTDSGTPSGWNIEYGPTGFVQGSGTVVSAGTNPFTLGSLSPNTTYDVYVQADCGGGDLSYWTGPVSFTTLCSAVVAPWIYDVESATPTTNSSIADCWSSNPTGTTASFRWDIDGNGSTPSASTGPTGAYSGVNYFYTEASSGTTGAVAELYTPMVDISALTVPSLQFYYHMYGSTMGELHVDVFDGTTWTNDVDVIIGQQQTDTADPWLQKVVSLATFSGTIQVRFRAIRGTDFYGDMSLDDITFDEAPACLPPANLVLSNITDTTVQIDWDDMSAVNQFDFEYVVQAAGTGTPTGNGTATDQISVIEGGLTQQTAYEVYVRADCGGGSYSSWVGPLTFTTACSAFVAPYNEPFAVNSLPACWTQGGATAWEYGSNVTTPTGFADYGADFAPDYNGAGGTFIGMDGSDNTDGEVSTLTSPFIDVTPLTTPRLKYAVFSNNINDAAQNLLEVEVWDGAAWNLVNTVQSNLGANWVVYTTDLTTLTITGNVQVRYTVTGVANGGFTFYNDILIDDVTIEETPTTPPACATNVVGTPDASCGNFDNVLSWDAVSGADGYYLTVGTTTGGNDVLDNQDMGAGVTYTFAGTINTTYYFTVVPYNANGSATGCSEVLFTTAATGCYCTSVPTSNDGSGITNVDIATTSFPNGDVTYFDYTATPVDLGQGDLANVQVTFATGYTYDTNIWIDFNDDFIFDATELVFDGVSTATNPTTLDASFTMPLTAPLGPHTMRIGTADTGQATPNPCYSGTYGVTLDFTANITLSLSNESFNVNSFVAYPNPVKDVLNLEYSSNITAVKVINMLGQEVISKDVNASTSQVDMSHLNAGTYLVNVFINDSIKTIKIVKQ